MKTLGVTLPVVARSTSTSLGGVAGTSRDCRDGSTPVQFAVMQMGCHVDAVRRMLQQMASTGSDSCSSARASRRSVFSVSRRCHFHPGHSAFDHRPSGQVRRLADGRRLLHGSCTASLSPRGKGASPRPARGTAPRTSCSPQSRLHRCRRRPSPAIACRRPPSPSIVAVVSWPGRRVCNHGRACVPRRRTRARAVGCHEATPHHQKRLLRARARPSPAPDRPARRNWADSWGVVRYK